LAWLDTSGKMSEIFDCKSLYKSGIENLLAKESPIPCLNIANAIFVLHVEVQEAAIAVSKFLKCRQTLLSYRLIDNLSISVSHTCIITE